MGLDAELWQAAECNDIDKVGFSFLCLVKSLFWFFVKKTSVGDIDKVGVDFFLCLVIKNL